MDYANSVVKFGRRYPKKFVQKVGNKPHNILFTTQKLTDVMGKAHSFCGKASRRMESTSGREPNGVSRSRCGLW
jgi:hypothetical protein